MKTKTKIKKLKDALRRKESSPNKGVKKIIIKLTCLK